MATAAMATIWWRNWCGGNDNGVDGADGRTARITHRTGCSAGDWKSDGVVGWLVCENTKLRDGHSKRRDIYVYLYIYILMVDLGCDQGG